MDNLAINLAVFTACIALCALYEAIVANVRLNKLVDALVELFTAIRDAEPEPAAKAKPEQAKTEGGAP